MYRIREDMYIEMAPKSRSINGPLVMPFSNVMHLKYENKLRATQRAGFGELSMHPHEVRDILASGISAKKMLALANDFGVRIRRLEPLSNWNPYWLPKNMNIEYVRNFDISAIDFFEMCEKLGCTYATINPTFSAGDMTFDQIAEQYAKVCKLGAEHGVICDLQNIPMWAIKTVRQAWEIVRKSGVPNGGLVFDTLHYIRSRSTLDMLREIPADQIHCIQINDGPLRLTESIRLEENCFERLWPCEGEFPLVELLSVLAEKGCLNQVSPEVFSRDNNGRTVDEIAKLSSDSIRKVLTLAKIHY